MLKLVTKKWVEVNDLSGVQYFFNKKITFKTSMLTSDLYDYDDVDITIKGKMAVTRTNDADRRNKKANL